MHAKLVTEYCQEVQSHVRSRNVDRKSQYSEIRIRWWAIKKDNNFETRTTLLIFKIRKIPRQRIHRLFIESMKLNVYLFTHVMYKYLFLMDYYLYVYQMFIKANVKKQMLKQISEVQSGALLTNSDIIWRRQWQATPVHLPRKSHGWRSLVGCSPGGC